MLTPMVRSMHFLHSHYIPPHNHSMVLLHSERCQPLLDICSRKTEPIVYYLTAFSAMIFLCSCNTDYTGLVSIPWIELASSTLWNCSEEKRSLPDACYATHAWKHLPLHSRKNKQWSAPREVLGFPQMTWNTSHSLAYWVFILSTMSVTEILGGNNAIMHSTSMEFDDTIQHIHGEQMAYLVAVAELTCTNSRPECFRCRCWFVKVHTCLLHDVCLICHWIEMHCIVQQHTKMISASCKILYGHYLQIFCKATWRLSNNTDQSKTPRLITNVISLESILSVLWNAW